MFSTQATDKNWVHYKMQWNHYLDLQRKTKKSYFANFNIKDKTDSKAFFKTVKNLYFQKRLFRVRLRKFVTQ